MPPSPEAQADRLAARLGDLPPGRRLVALAGPPGAGKSTVSALLAARLAAGGRRAAVVPMDGFHLDNAVLEGRGLLARKGAPETFDAAGFVHLVRRIAAGEAGVVYPVFDRARDLAVAGAGVLEEGVEVVIFEGNYLLLREAPWADLAELWDLSAFIDAAPERIEARLVARWRDEGFAEREARARVEGNDLPNVARVREGSAAATVDLREEA